MKNAIAKQITDAINQKLAGSHVVDKVETAFEKDVNGNERQRRSTTIDFDGGYMMLVLIERKPEVTK